MLIRGRAIIRKNTSFLFSSFSLFLLFSFCRFPSCFLFLFHSSSFHSPTILDPFTGQHVQHVNGQKRCMLQTAPQRSNYLEIERCLDVGIFPKMVATRHHTSPHVRHRQSSRPFRRIACCRPADTSKCPQTVPVASRTPLVSENIRLFCYGRRRTPTFP